MAKRLKQDNVDVVGKKCIRNDDGKLARNLIIKSFWMSNFHEMLQIWVKKPQ